MKLFLSVFPICSPRISGQWSEALRHIGYISIIFGDSGVFLKGKSALPHYVEFSPLNIVKNHIF